MKMNLKVFKKGKPIYWVIGAVILFVIFYLVASRGAGGNTAAKGTAGGVVSYNAGPSDAQIMAASQISAMQIEANAATNMSAMELAKFQEEASAAVTIAAMENSLNALAVNAEQALGELAYNTDLTIGLASIDAQKEANYLQAEYSITTARIASDTELGLRNIDRAMFADQLDNNRAMLEIQSENMIAQTALSQVGTLKKKDRDNTLQMLARQFSSGDNSANPYTYSKDTFLGL